MLAARIARALNQKETGKLGLKEQVALIRAETWLSCPPLGDIAGMRGHAVRVITDLSRFAKNEEMRFKCAMALLQLAEKTERAADPNLSVNEERQVLQNLRKFYSKIEELPNDRLVLEDDGQNDPIDVRAIAGPIVIPEE